MGNGRGKQLAVRAVPWIAVAVIVWLLLRRYPAEEIAKYIEEGNVLGTIPFALAAGVVTLFLMAFADYLVFSNFGKLRYRDVLAGKGASSILVSVTHSAGTGLYGVWLARAIGTNTPRTIGIIAYTTLSDLTALCCIVIVPLSLPSFEMAGLNRPLIITFCGIGVAALSMVALLGPKYLPKVIGRPELFAPWLELGLRTFLATVSVRIVSVSFMMVCTYFAAAAFGLDLPVVTMLGWLPAIYLAGALPINVGGFGAVQGMWIFAFERYGIPGAQLIAFQVLYNLATNVVLLMRGAPFLSTAIRVRSQPTQTVVHAPTAHATSDGENEPASHSPSFRGPRLDNHASDRPEKRV